MSEVEGLFDFLQSIYGLFGFSFKLNLSTRPDNYMGEIPTWDYAEGQLKKALEKFKPGDWSIDEGGGAFYGPKIDITLNDSLGRDFQCATIQLDYQAPQNFKMVSFRISNPNKDITDVALGVHDQRKGPE